MGRDSSPYVPVHAAIRTHRKLARLARAWGVKFPQALGHLVFLWLAAIEQTRDGRLVGWDEEDVADACWHEDKELCLTGLLEAGWLERDGDDLRLHGWEDYVGRFMAQRDRARERARTSRQRAAACGDVPHGARESEREIEREEEECTPSAPCTASAYEHVHEDVRRWWDALAEVVRKHGGALYSLTSGEMLRLEAGKARDEVAKLAAEHPVAFAKATEYMAKKRKFGRGNVTAAIGYLRQVVLNTEEPAAGDGGGEAHLIQPSFLAKP